MNISNVTLQGVTVEVTYDPSVLTGLVYYIDAGKSSSYPGSGSTLNDISGQGLGASTLVNNPTFTSSGASSYFDFNGTNQYIWTGNLLSKFNPPSNSNLTLEIWTYAPTDNGDLIVENGTNTLDDSWYDSQQEIVSGVVKMRVYEVPPTSPGVFVTAGTYNRSTWNQTVLTYNGTTLRTYINAVAGGTATGTRLLPWNYGEKGLYYSLMAPTIANMGNGGYLACSWSVFKVYNRALTASEVTQNFDALKVRYGL